MTSLLYLEKHMMLVLELYFKYLNFELIVSCCKSYFALFIDKFIN